MRQTLTSCTLRRISHCGAGALIFLLCSFPALGQGTPSSPPKAPPAPPTQGGASLLLRWIDVKGNIYPGGKVTKMAWVWSHITQNDQAESPALRLWITSRLPADWQPQKTTGDGVTVSDPLSRGDTQTMVVDLRASKGTLRFEFIDSQQRLSEMTLAIQVTVPRPYILVKPECGKQDLKFLVHKTQAQHLFVGLNCVDRGDSFDIYFFRSKDSLWNRTEGLIQFDPENKFTAFKHHVGKPKDQVVYSQRLFRVGTLDENGNQTEYSVVYNPRVKPKRFYFSAGLGATMYNYKEELGGLNLKQNSLTGKVNAGYRLIPRVLDVAFNFFGNLIAVTHTPATFAATGVDLPAARFYGLNGRIGYRLPVGMGASEFMFLTGWYVWGMNVPPANRDPETNVYGIKALSGPQLFLMMLNTQAGHKGFWTYFKFAFISDLFRITTDGREIAAGAGFELSARETKPFSLTFDIAHAQFRTEPGAAVQNGMKLLSITAGIQKSF